MNKKPGYQIRAVIIAMFIVGAFAVATVPNVSADGGNKGTIKVHDDEVADPDQRNVPHVSCDFWIEGFNMRDSSGELVFYHWPPGGNKSVVAPAGDDLDWTGVPADKDGYDFLKGPYQLPPGHYRVEAFSDNSGHDHFSKAKTFWSDGCDEDNPCLGLELMLTQNEGGSITVNVTHASGSLGSGLYRSVEGGPFDFVDAVLAPNTEYVDEDTEIGKTYAYAGTALYAQFESQPCDSAETTSIPVFPGAIAASLAALIGLLGYAFVRRRA